MLVARPLPGGARVHPTIDLHEGPPAPDHTADYCSSLKLLLIGIDGSDAEVLVLILFLASAPSAKTEASDEPGR
jgi:hypothetical protein